MRLVTFTDGSRPRVGIAVDEGVIDLSVAAPGLPRSMTEFLVAGDDALEAARNAEISDGQRIPIEAVSLLAPIPRPQKFLAVGLNYADHVAETRRELPPTPTVFSKMPSCIIGPRDAVVLPSVSSQLDYEGELGIVIGRACRYASLEEARTVIAGYVVINDVSVRDWQWQTSQWTLGKSFDTHGPMGPWIMTADELPDPHDLPIRTLVNGEIRQRSNTKHLIHNCFALIEHISTVCTLEPGDVIATGTPSGVGSAMTPPRWLAAGDVVRVEIDGLGALENQIVAERGDYATLVSERDRYATQHGGE